MSIWSNPAQSLENEMKIGSYIRIKNINFPQVGSDWELPHLTVGKNYKVLDTKSQNIATILNDIDDRITVLMVGGYHLDSGNPKGIGKGEWEVVND